MSSDLKNLPGQNFFFSVFSPKGSVLEKRERPVGRLHPHDAERLLRLLGSRKSGEGGGGNAAASTFGAHPAAFPSYSLMFVVALKRELCVQAHAPCFQVHKFKKGVGKGESQFG